MFIKYAKSDQKQLLYKKCLPYSNCLLKCTIFCSIPLSLLTKAVCKHTACWIITCTHTQNSDILLYKIMQLEISYRKQWTAHTVFYYSSSVFCGILSIKGIQDICTSIGLCIDIQGHETKLWKQNKTLLESTKPL